MADARQHRDQNMTSHHCFGTANRRTDWPEGDWPGPLTTPTSNVPAYDQDCVVQLSIWTNIPRGRASAIEPLDKFVGWEPLIAAARRP
jgi:hypothetical protein